MGEMSYVSLTKGEVANPVLPQIAGRKQEDAAMHIQEIGLVNIDEPLTKVSITTSKGLESKVFRPAVLKTFLKAVIAVAVLSLFLEINSHAYLNYLLFLTIVLGMAAVLCLVKRQTAFKIDNDGIHIKRMLHRPSVIPYDRIYDVSVSQGVLARRFGCGTVFVVLKNGHGSVRLMGGGVAEKLEDVRNPQEVSAVILSKLGSFGGAEVL